MKQESRVALIELLFLALYLDNHLSLAEDGVLSEAMDSIGWESGQPREICFLTAFSKVRALDGDAVALNDFLEQRAEIIAESGHQSMALTWLTKVLGADGITPGEERFLKKLEKRWFS
ncbi:MAG: hypothetical protein MUF31_00085 [Akkermansiaceae bacterium]|jgi:hypothetical protein|nr:hypothetical protein [Akkermansiaceae bacterium]